MLRDGDGAQLCHELVDAYPHGPTQAYYPYFAP